MENKIKVALIYGSTREGRFCDTVAGWAEREIALRSEFALDVIDPVALVLPVRHEQVDSPELKKLSRRIDGADTFVVVTPEYNHAYPAALKFLIDCFREEWRAKPVAFVAYGGLSGGLRAVEQLRLVFAELHAVSVRDSVSFVNVWEQFNVNGDLKRPENARQAMATMLGSMKWWALALRDARRAIPYEELAA